MGNPPLSAIHILGSGDPFDPSNHIYRARLDAVSDTKAHTVTIHSRQQTGMATSEAQLGYDWLHNTYGDAINMTIWLEEKSKSTAETMHDIVSHMSPDAHGISVIVTNWPYMPRVRYLLRKAWEARHPSMPWKIAAQRFRFMSIGGTFVPYWKEQGWRTVPWWLWSVGMRELGAWVKALLDPHDTKLNQNRGSAKRF